MAIADRVYELRQRPTIELRIGGVLITPTNPLALDGRPGIYALRFSEHYDEETRLATPPELQIDVSRIPREWMRIGMPVTLDAGYDGEMVREFTGGVWALGEEDPNYLRTQCIGTGVTDADGVRLEATATVIGGPAVWPPIPSGQQIDFGIDNHLAHTQDKLDEMVVREAGRRNRIPRKPGDSREKQTIYCKGDLVGAFRDFKITARDLSGEDVGASVEGVLDDSGIASHNIDIGTYTLAAEGATLDRMPGAGMLTPLLMLQGGAVRQLPSGLVIGRVIDEQPAPTPSFRYRTTDQQYARIVSADPPLIQVPFNPLAQVWQTHEIELDYLGIDGNWFVVGHEWTIDFEAATAMSWLDYRGGEQFGSTIGINPTASFTYSVALQVIGDELYYTITVIDTSTDSDGTIDQAASTWICNQTTIPNINTFDGEPVATVRIAVADVAGDLIITRHVEDNDGLTDDFAQTIDLSASSSLVTVPPFYVAAGTRRMATLDGGQDWHDTTPSSKTATAVGARLADGVNSGHAVYGHSNGSLDLTLDGNQTIAAALAAISPTSQFNDVQWDWRDHRFVWALTDDCRLYVSTDYGVSFFLLHDLRTVTYGGFGGTTPAALGNKLGLPPGGWVNIFGGDGAGRPLIAYNASPFGGVGNTWIRQAHLGDLLTDLVTPADNTMRIVDYVAPGYGGATMILAWASGGEATLRAIYHTDSTAGNVPSETWTRATGLTAGLKNGRVMMESGPLSPVRRIAMFGDDDTWQSVDGIAYTLAGVANLPAGFTPNHGLFVSSVLGGLPSVYEHIIAVEDATGTGGVMKSTDEGLTWNYVRPATGFDAWVAGAKAKKIAIGAPVSTSSAAGFVGISHQTAGNDKFQYMRNSTLWSAEATYPTEGGRPFWLKPNAIFVCKDNGIAPCYSTDGGDTFNTMPAALTGAVWFDVDAGGRIWALVETSGGADVKIYYSDDDGANWSGGTGVLDKTTGSFTSGLIVCHETNQNRICVMGMSGSSAWLYITYDRGVTWTEYTGGTRPKMPDPGVVGGTSGAHWFANNRIVVFGNGIDGTAGWKVMTSDDSGPSSSTWTVRYTDTTSGLELSGMGARFDGKMVIGHAVETGSPFVTKPLVSLDYGSNWALAEPALTLQDFTGGATTAIRGTDYDPFDDSWYVGVQSSTHTIVKLTPVTAAGRWYNLKSNFSANDIGIDGGVAVIPR